MKLSILGIALCLFGVCCILYWRVYVGAIFFVAAGVEAIRLAFVQVSWEYRKQVLFDDWYFTDWQIRCWRVKGEW